MVGDNTIFLFCFSTKLENQHLNLSDLHCLDQNTYFELLKQVVALVPFGYQRFELAFIAILTLRFIVTVAGFPHRPTQSYRSTYADLLRANASLIFRWTFYKLMTNLTKSIVLSVFVVVEMFLDVYTILSIFYFQACCA